LVDDVEEDQQPDGAGNDQVGGVGLDALHVEPAEGLEQFQAGGDEQRGSQHPAQRHP
jgi:hypothetical protein